MKRLTEGLKRALSALAWSEAGELRPHWEKAALLDGKPPPAPSPRASTYPGAITRAAAQRSNREVALACGDALPQTVVDYAVGLCRRLESRLAFLSRGTPEQAELMVGAHATRLESAGVDWCVVALADDSPARLARYIRDNPQVVVLVSSGSDDPLQSLVGRGRRACLPNGLPVPLVVVAQGTDRAA